MTLRRCLWIKDDPVEMEDAEIAIELAPGARLAGHVRDDTGKPVASATITARAIDVSGQTEPWTTLCSDDGAFAFETLPRAAILLEVDDGGAHETTTLAEVAVPNCYFHVTTAYAILRHNGVGLGKMDYVGSLPISDA